MREATKGIWAMVAACTVWGLSPLYYAQLAHVPPLEVLSYRSLWSLVFFAGVLVVQGRLGLVLDALRNRRQAATVAASGLLIASNWFGFIFAITNGHATEASLGYYMFPLFAVVLGRVVLGERLGWVQWAAVALAALAVLVLTVGLGAVPSIALMLAATFAAYGLIKKRLALGPVVSVTGEVLLLAPLALGWIVLMGTGAGGGNATGTHLLLALSGPLTATPLILFSYATKRVRLSTVGLVQYLNPTLQFLCAVLWFAEPFTPWHAIAFPMIWVALTLYSVSGLARDRAARRAAAVPV